MSTNAALSDSDRRPAWRGVRPQRGETPSRRFATARGKRNALGVALLVLGIGAALLALLGPLGAGALDYHVSEAALRQVMGSDVAALGLIAPVAVVAGVLVFRRKPLGPALALGPAAYGLYMYFQLAVAGDPVRYTGTSEQFFPFLLGMFLLAGFICVSAWPMVESITPSPSSRRVDRIVGWFLIVVAAFLTLGLHLPGLVSVWHAQPGTEYLNDPVVFWVVKMMDLGVVVPVVTVVGIGLVRRREWARRLRYAVTGWAALLASSVAGMAIVMQAQNDPAGTLANTVAFSLFALVAVILAALVHRDLVHGTRVLRTNDDPGGVVCRDITVPSAVEVRHEDVDRL